MNNIHRFVTILLSVLMLSSCGDDSIDAVTEELAVAPASLELSAASGAGTMEVIANCSWTVEALPAEGVDASWLILAKSKGTGNSAVNFRVMENKYNSERKASVVFTTDGGMTASVTVVQAAAEGGEEVSSIQIRVGSYNIRIPSSDDKTNEYRNWATRKGFLWSSIQQCDFDIVGLQEVSLEQQEDLNTQWGGIYGMHFFSPYSRDGKGDKAQGIMYRKNLFSLSDVHFFWIGPDPEKMSTSDVGSDGAKYNRGGVCGILTHKATGIRIFFMDTHGCLNKDTGAQYAGLFEEMEKKYNTENLPAFFVGDLNATPDHAMLKTITSYWTDSYLKAKKKEGIVNTFNSWTNVNGLRRIDYVLYRNVSAPSLYCCDNTLYNGHYPSDHFPVYADFTINK